MIARSSLAALLTLLVAITALWVAGPSRAPLPQSPVRAALKTERPELAVLRRFSRLDLRDMDPKELLTLRVALRNLAPERTSEPLGKLSLYRDPRPQHVWPYRRDGRVEGWVVFERQIEMESPDPDRFWLTYLDSRGTMRAHAMFDSGSRRHFGEARLDDLPGIDGPVLQVVVLYPCYVDNNPVAERRWYARVGRHFEHVRREQAGAQGEPVPRP